MKPFEILMFGPAYGHNIKPFLDFFNKNHEQYLLTFIYSGKNTFAINSEFKNIEFIELKKTIPSVLNLIKTLRHSFHLIWNHGAYNIIELLLITCFKKKNSFFNINIWGERIPILASKNNFIGKLYKLVFNQSDIIQLNWYGTQKLILDTFPNKETKVFPWGLDNQYFTETSEKLSEFSEKFIESLPSDKTKFFYPKSFSTASDHEAIIKACKILKQKNISNFVVYFWLGNITDENLEKKYTNLIKDYFLGDNIKIVKHPFLSFFEMKKIWEQMNVGLQIAINDQFSTTVLEPLLFKKEIIITNIFPYKKLIKLYPELELNLIVIKDKLIANEMNKYIEGKLSSYDLLEKRKQFVINEFNFEKNIIKMLDFYKSGINV